MLEVSEAIKPKTQPLRSIGLKPIDHNMPAHDFHCECEMCNQYEANKVCNILQNRTAAVNRKIKEKLDEKRGKNPQTVFGNYKWILKHLMTPHNKIINRGLSLFIPEVVFYKDGEAIDLFCNREVDDPVVKRANREKISSNFVQKIFGDRRRKYREMIQAFLGLKKVVVEKKPLFGRKKAPKKEAKDAVVIKYRDGYEQLSTENEFMSLLQLRKQAPVWKQIAYIKNFIPVDDCQKRVVVVRFSQEQIKYEQLFKRSKTLMKVYADNIQKGDRDFISDEQETKFSQSILRESQKIFADYLVYKLVSFIQLFYDERITKITVKILINELGNGYLEDVYKLEKQALVKFEWTNETYLKKMDEYEKKVIYSKNVEVTEQVTKNADKIGEVFSEQYEEMKDYFGLSNVEPDNHEEIANNQFFKKIHPNIEEPITELLMKPEMTVNNFKKTYLGFKPARKPIVRPFTCNMIHSLHKITPQLKNSSPHNYIGRPKQRTASTSFSMNEMSRMRSSKVSRPATTGFVSPRSYY